MKQNVGRIDRIARALMGLGLVVAALVAPVPLAVRALAFGAMGAYLLMAALSGRCVGYHLLGRSTCSLTARP